MHRLCRQAHQELAHQAPQNVSEAEARLRLSIATERARRALEAQQLAARSKAHLIRYTGYNLISAGSILGMCWLIGG